MQEIEKKNLGNRKICCGTENEFVPLRFPAHPSQLAHERTHVDLVVFTKVFTVWS